jgi:hypothetical protein
MRPSLWFALCGIGASVSTGCTLVSDIAGSSVVAGDQRGGTVSRVTTFTQSGALNMAASWCAQYGLVAQEVQIIFATDSMDFACVSRPAYQSPAYQSPAYQSPAYQPQPLFNPPA